MYIYIYTRINTRLFSRGTFGCVYVWTYKYVSVCEHVRHFSVRDFFWREHTTLFEGYVRRNMHIHKYIFLFLLSCFPLAIIHNCCWERLGSILGKGLFCTIGALLLQTGLFRALSRKRGDMGWLRLVGSTKL